jgi:hypothetical protein
MFNDYADLCDKPVKAVIIPDYNDDIYITEFNNIEDLCYIYRFRLPTDYKGYSIRLGVDKYNTKFNISVSCTGLVDLGDYIFGSVAVVIDDDDRITYDELRDLIYKDINN